MSVAKDAFVAGVIGLSVAATLIAVAAVVNKSQKVINLECQRDQQTAAAIHQCAQTRSCVTTPANWEFVKEVEARCLK